MISLCVVLKSILMSPTGSETLVNDAQCNRVEPSFTVGTPSHQVEEIPPLLGTDHSDGLNTEYFVLCI